MLWPLFFLYFNISAFADDCNLLNFINRVISQRDKHEPIPESIKSSLSDHEYFEFQISDSRGQIHQVSSKKMATAIQAFENKQKAVHAFNQSLADKMKKLFSKKSVTKKYISIIEEYRNHDPDSFHRWAKKITADGKISTLNEEDLPHLENWLDLFKQRSKKVLSFHEIKVSALPHSESSAIKTQSIIADTRKGKSIHLSVLEDSFDILYRKSAQMPHYLHEVDVAFSLNGVANHWIKVTENNELIIDTHNTTEKVFGLNYKAAIEFKGALSNKPNFRTYGIVFKKGFVEHYSIKQDFVDHLTREEQFIRASNENKLFLKKSESGRSQLHVYFDMKNINTGDRSVDMATFLRNNALGVMEVSPSGDILNVKFFKSH